MADKMSCLSCDAYSSSVLQAYMNGEPCPYCNLPAEVTIQLKEARKRGADEKLVDMAAQAEQRASSAEAELARLQALLVDFERQVGLIFSQKKRE